jgi:Rps23 Pro-64 3,4-dihydroxylase Tpa1-like proline 4-hydroxylase
MLLQVTAIFYLNQHWKPSHGGQLRLYPFPAPPVDIQPLQDRLVLFASTRMLHRYDAACHATAHTCCLGAATQTV